jgi:hypothetical protein
MEWDVGPVLAEEAVALGRAVLAKPNARGVRLLK